MSYTTALLLLLGIIGKAQRELFIPFLLTDIICVGFARGHWSIPGVQPKSRPNETAGMEDMTVVEQYTKEFFQPMANTKNGDISFSFFKQVRIPIHTY